jgi:hypothetical protein
MIGLAETAILGTNGTLTIINKISMNMILGTIKNATSLIYNIMSGIFAYNSDHVKPIKNILTELDLKYKISVLDAFLSEIVDYDFQESIIKALNGVTETLINIKDELYVLNNTIDINNHKWFSRYKNINYDEYIVDIRIYDKILEKRIKILFNLLKIYKIQKTSTKFY